jgi:hypothetical protein
VIRHRRRPTPIRATSSAIAHSISRGSSARRATGSGLRGARMGRGTSRSLGGTRSRSSTATSGQSAEQG